MHFRGTAAIESLESRRLLSVTVAAKKATLDIVGTAGDDKILVTAHPSLINFVNVVVKNAGGREDVYVATGRFSTIKVDALGGDDEIMIDNSLRGLAPDVTVWLDGGAGNDRVLSCPLPGTIAMRDGNDIVKGTTAERFTVYGDAGNDRLEFAVGAHVINGGDGNDTLVAGDGNSELRGGAGDDRLAAGIGFYIAQGNDGNDDLRVPAAQKRTVDAGSGDDVVTLYRPADTEDESGSNTVLGGDGDDTLNAAPYGDSLDGGAGDDRLYAARGQRVGTFQGGEGDDVLVAAKGTDGLSFYGGNGDDILDGRGSNRATLYGGDGNDDLYAGTDTTGRGQGGRDWFSDSKWREKDQDDEDIRLGGSPNSGWYGGVNYGSVDFSGGTGLVIEGGMLTPVGSTRVELRRLDDLGFVTTSTTGATAIGARTVATIPNSQVTNAARRLSPTLLAAERKGMRHGILRLPGGWKVGQAAVRQGDVVWYDVTVGSADDPGYVREFGHVYQLAVKAGTVVVSDESSAVVERPIARTRSDVRSLWLPPGRTARIAGVKTTYTISGDVLDAASIKAPKGQRGILVDGGAIWLASDKASTTFVAG